MEVVTPEKKEKVEESETETEEGGDTDEEGKLDRAEGGI